MFSESSALDTGSSLAQYQGQKISPDVGFPLPIGSWLLSSPFLGGNQCSLLRERLRCKSLLAQREESSCNTGDASSILGLGRFSGRTKCINPLQYSCLEKKKIPCRATIGREGAKRSREWGWFGVCHFRACAWLSVRQFLKDGSLGFRGEQGADISSLEKPKQQQQQQRPNKQMCLLRTNAAAPSRPPP